MPDLGSVALHELCSNCSVDLHVVSASNTAKIAFFWLSSFLSYLIGVALPHIGVAVGVRTMKQHILNNIAGELQILLLRVWANDEESKQAVGMEWLIVAM